MGKPIAGQNQFPYSIGGFLVDGAKINGITYTKKLYIYKQRSYNMYDLQDDKGNIFQFIEIGWEDTSGNELNYFDISEDLVKTIPDNTFFMKIQDPARDIFSFVRIYQWHKCITSGGDYVYRTSDIDPRLAGVLINPTISTIQLGSTAAYESLFFPSNYPDKNGNWYVSPYNKNSADNISIVGSDKNKSVIKGESLGKAILTFVPSNNDSLVTHSIVNVVNSDLKLKLFQVFCSTPYTEYAAGTEYTLNVVTYPYDYKLTKELNVQITDTDSDEQFSTELVRVSDDFKSYTFKTSYTKTMEWGYPMSNPEFLFTMDEPIIHESYMSDVYVYNEDYYEDAYSQPGCNYLIPVYLRPNMTFTMEKTLDGPNTKVYPYVSSDPTIATIDSSTGVITTYNKKGSVTFATKYDNLDLGTQVDITTRTLTIIDEVYDSIVTTPTHLTQLYPNEVIQYKAIGYRDGYEPQELPFYTTPLYPESYSVTESGLVTVTSNPKIGISTHLRHDNSISDDTQLLSVYKSSGLSPRIATAGTVTPMTGIYTTTDSDNRTMFIRYLEDGYEASTYFITYPLPYTTTNYQMKFVSYDESIIEIVEKDFVESTWQYNMGGSLFPYVKPLKRGDTKIVMQSVHYPDVVVTITIIVY